MLFLLRIGRSTAKQLVLMSVRAERLSLIHPSEAWNKIRVSADVSGKSYKYAKSFTIDYKQSVETLTFGSTVRCKRSKIVHRNAAVYPSSSIDVAQSSMSFQSTSSNIELTPPLLLVDKENHQLSHGGEYYVMLSRGHINSHDISQFKAKKRCQRLVCICVNTAHCIFIMLLYC